jgi:hypothetical protein
MDSVEQGHEIAQERGPPALLRPSLGMVAIDGSLPSFPDLAGRSRKSQRPQRIGRNELLDRSDREP